MFDISFLGGMDWSAGSNSNLIRPVVVDTTTPLPSPPHQRPSLETPFGVTFSYDFVDNSPLYSRGVYYFALEHVYRGLESSKVYRRQPNGLGSMVATFGDDLNEHGVDPESDRFHEDDLRGYVQFESQMSHRKLPQLSDFTARFLTAIVQAEASYEFGVVFIEPRSFQPIPGSVVNVLMSVDGRYFYEVHGDWNGDSYVPLKRCRDTLNLRVLDYETGDWTNRDGSFIDSGPSTFTMDNITNGSGSDTTNESAKLLTCTMPTFSGGSVPMRCYVEPPSPAARTAGFTTVFPPGRYQVAYTYVVHTGSSSDSETTAESDYSVWTDVSGGTSVPWRNIKVVNWAELVSQPNWPVVNAFRQRLALNVYVKRWRNDSSTRPNSNDQDYEIYLAAEDQAIPDESDWYRIENAQLCRGSAADGSLDCVSLKCYADGECPDGCECVDRKCRVKPPPVPDPVTTNLSVSVSDVSTESSAMGDSTTPQPTEQTTPPPLVVNNNAPDTTNGNSNNGSMTVTSKLLFGVAGLGLLLFVAMMVYMWYKMNNFRAI